MANSVEHQEKQKEGGWSRRTIIKRTGLLGFIGTLFGVALDV